MSIPINTLIRSKRKTLALEINKHAELIVRAPARMPQQTIIRFIKEKQNWIQTKQTKQKQKLIEVPKKNFQNGESFYFLGEYYELMVQENFSEKFSFRKGFILCDSVAHKSDEILTEWFKKKAKKILPERVAYFAQLHQFSYNEVKISSAQKRWGSCNKKKNLNFSWRLIMAPLKVIDYVVVHELAHTKEMNHSKDFWNIVERLYPSFRIHKKWLKENGHKLTI